MSNEFNMPTETVELPSKGLLYSGDLVLIRGGWGDRKGNYFEETPIKNGLGSLNVFFKNVTADTLYNKTQQEKFNELKRNKGTTIATGNNSRSSNTGSLLANSTQKIIKNL